MQSVLVGAEVGGCAFVCGSLSFLDKMSCGLALYVLQSHQSKSNNLMTGTWPYKVYNHSFFTVRLAVLCWNCFWFTATSPRGQLNNNQQSVYLSVTRYGLGLVPALCSFVGVAVTFFMELEAAGSLSKPLLREPLLEWQNSLLRLKTLNARLFLLNMFDFWFTNILLYTKFARFFRRRFCT